ncbi:MAG: hypothetical protein EXQ89_08015 [Rhodospirillaceae bacterium]|nr:hypothetical protein [Rhodospirillaceae bacterium]
MSELAIPFVVMFLTVAVLLGLILASRSWLIQRDQILAKGCSSPDGWCDRGPTCLGCTGHPG